jgi:pyrroline-5-carboxylate reductase
MSDPKHALSMIRLAIIGGGQMARGLIGGLVARGLPARQITVSEPMAESRAQLERDFGVQVTADNAGAVSGAQVVILAVKPQGMAEVASALAHVFAAASPLIISVAAGIRAVDLARWCGGHVAVVRAMPNRPALVGAGANARRPKT